MKFDSEPIHGYYNLKTELSCRSKSVDKRVNMTFFDYNEKGTSDSKNEKITVLEGLTEDEWNMVIRQAQSISFSAGEILLKENEYDDAVYILVSGLVEVLGKQSFGRSAQIATIEEGSVFGEVAFFDNKPRSASIRAINDGQVLRLSRKGFEQIAAWNPKLAQQFLFDLGSILAYRFRSEFPYKI